MENSVQQTVTGLKDFLQKLDKLLLEKALEWARERYREILEAIDKAIAESRSKEFTITDFRLVWYQTCLGPVRVQRRQYRDSQGKYRYLLDELMGMGKRDHTTVTVKDLALYLATIMPYRRVAEVLHKITAIDLTHQTIHRLVGEVADPYLKKSAEELQWFMETGEAGRQAARRG